MTGKMMDEAGHAESDELKLQKREAYQRFSAVWEDALGAGIEPEILAHVALFAALGDLVATYGETAVAGFAERLPGRITAGEFSIPHKVH
jgi:hypothetical protein